MAFAGSAEGSGILVTKAPPGFTSFYYEILRRHHACLPAEAQEGDNKEIPSCHPSHSPMNQ